ncbi:MAG: hypothetical protein EHM72_03800 [Calditrichaeota bacterium]|nr:MAG: hypothetical protein EHM72_03800 [Calditrichota bacterium]
MEGANAATVMCGQMNGAFHCNKEKLVIVGKNQINFRPAVAAPVVSTLFPTCLAPTTKTTLKNSVY